MSGADHEPPLGFAHEPKVSFLYGSGRFCTASTFDACMRTTMNSRLHGVSI